MNNRDFANNFNAVRTQVRTQLGIIESAFASNGSPVTGLQAWWFVKSYAYSIRRRRLTMPYVVPRDVFLDDFLSQVQQWAQDWTSDAIAEASRPFTTAQGRILPNAEQVMNTLLQWENQISTITFGNYYLGSLGTMQLPQPPGGGGS